MKGPQRDPRTRLACGLEGPWRNGVDGRPQNHFQHCTGAPTGALWLARGLSGLPVDRLTDQVGVAEVAGVLLDQVEEDPAQVR